MLSFVYQITTLVQSYAVLNLEVGRFEARLVFKSSYLKNKSDDIWFLFFDYVVNVINNRIRNKKDHLFIDIYYLKGLCFHTNIWRRAA